MKFNLLFSLLSSTQIELFCEFELACVKKQVPKSLNFTKYPLDLRFTSEFLDLQPNFTSNSLNCAEILADRCKYGVK